MEIIKVKNLSKEFDVSISKSGFTENIKSFFLSKKIIKKAVDDISFSINQGDIIGYIGPNGSGKSTTIKMLSGILVPTNGEVTVNGVVPYKNRVQNAFNIGVVFGQKTQLWWDIPLIESFKLSQKIYKIPQKEYEKRLDFFSELLDLREFINTPVRQLSLGQRMRGEVVLALLHNPPILYLDEPTIGLDVISKEKLRNFIKEQNRIEKTTIILTTHDMSDIEMLSSRIIITNKGKILADDSMGYFRKKHQTRKRIKITLKTPANNFSINNAQIIDDNELIKTFEFDPSKVSDKQILEEVVSKYDFIDVTVENESIDSIIKRYLQ